MALPSPYRGRLAPTPTGLMHLGHAATFHTAWQRALQAGGVLILRNEDLDPQRCQETFLRACLEDLAWLGLRWQEGPDCGGPFAPYSQSTRRHCYLEAWRHLRDNGFIYPCQRSRKDLAHAASAPHAEDEAAEPLYPPEWRPPAGTGHDIAEPTGINWRFRVPDGETIAFADGRAGPQQFTAGVDFGDFVVWRRDDVPAYELAVVVDDCAMEITEVVRGEDLLKSTARQQLLYRALGKTSPAFYHTPLLRDDSGRRLAKRHDALGIRALRQQGLSPEAVLAMAYEALPAAEA